MPDRGGERMHQDAGARWLRRRRAVRAARIAAQLALLLLAACLLLPRGGTRQEAAEAFARTPDAQAGEQTDAGFIAISYCGVTALDGMESGIVSRREFEEQLLALRDCGYQTITQQDILDYYEKGAPLPERALFLLLEDGILSSSTLAQDALERCGYTATFCTYAQYLSDPYSRFATAADVRRLLSDGCWELGTNGYRLAYINVFDRYGNFFGELDTNEFACVSRYLRRDYNHYLMDFLRDGDRVRLETPEQMRARISRDYVLMESAYTQQLGALPGLYVLMHANTGAFGNDELVSRENGEQLTRRFSMNFNRQGSCLNTRGSSIYDLTRLQSQPYFSTNHLLMRIRDDTGAQVAFVTGDETAAARWYQDGGAAQFRDNQLILTSEPRGEGRVTLREAFVRDVEVSATLEGNTVGRQSVYLRTDRALTGGVQVALENNELIVRDLSAGGAELLRLDLFELDGGAARSCEEDEYEGLEALQEAVIAYDEDAERVAQAREALGALRRTRARTLAEGGEPYVPALDVSARGSRQLRIRLTGDLLSVWIDGQPAAKELAVSAQGGGSVALGAGVWLEQEPYSQRNIADDVYDARFTDLVITGADGTALCDLRPGPAGRAADALENAWKRVLAFFMNSF